VFCDDLGLGLSGLIVVATEDTVQDRSDLVTTACSDEVGMILRRQQNSLSFAASLLVFVITKYNCCYYLPGWSELAER